MRVVQVAVDQVIDMVAVGNRLMAATRAMNVVGGMAATLVAGCAALGVLAVGFQYVFVDMIAMHVMQVPIMQIIDMSIVFDCRMAAARLVLMVMVWMLVAGTHSVLL